MIPRRASPGEPPAATIPGVNPSTDIRRVLSVSQLNAEVRGILDGFPAVWVEGEVSNLARPASGHLYFSLKDATAQVRCAIWRQRAQRLGFAPSDGMQLLVRARVGLYEPRGEYQLIVEHAEPAGDGALRRRFDELKRALAAEGLFDAERKRPLPRALRRVGIVTSTSGAALHDVLTTLARRAPHLEAVVYPTVVQGAAAADGIVAALSRAGKRAECEVLLLVRGGGSLEDLWPFNEESVARAIAACPIPVISAVGHETDVTIADFVADLRAPTPSAAAELAIRPKAEFLEMIATREARLAQFLRYKLAVAARRVGELGVERPAAVLRRRLGRLSQRTDELDYQLREHIRRRLLDAERRLAAATRRLQARDVRVELERGRARLGELSGALESLFRLRLTRLAGRLESLTSQLGHLSPLRVLERGYAIVEDLEGRLLRRAADTAPGRKLRVRLHQGRLRVEVRDVE